MADNAEPARLDAADARNGNGNGNGAGPWIEPTGRDRALSGPRLPAGFAALGAVAGMLAALAGQLAGDGPVAVLGGLVVGALVVLAGWAALRPLLGLDRAPAGRPRSEVPLAALPVAPAPAGPDARAAANLEPLVTAVGQRFLSLTDRQLASLGGPGASTVPPAAELEAARRLTLRTRRAASTLVVLADTDGSSAGLVRALPPGDRSVAEIIELALADSDHRDQVDTSSVHPATVDASAVGDLVHLLAELIDNAVTASNDPRTAVVVLGRRARDGYVLSVVDEGEGMPPTRRESANGQLAAPPTLGEQHAEALGLSVVGRLAARHGIGVVLLESATDGVIAKVRVPARLLDGGRAEAISPYQRTVEALAVAPADAPTEHAASSDDDTAVIDLREPDAEPDTDTDTEPEMEPDAAPTDAGAGSDEVAGPPGATRPGSSPTITRRANAARPARR